MNSLRTWLRGLALLRYPELVSDLGLRRAQLLQVAELQQRFPAAKISRDVVLLGLDPERLDLGARTTVGQGTVLSLGDQEHGPGRIRIGDRTWIGQYNNLRAGGGDIVIGKNCLISQFCSLVATNHACARSTPIQSQGADPTRRGVTLEDDVWLGAGAVVLPGVTIGTGAVIGANAVVNRDVPEYEIWAGVPARRVGER